MSYQTCLLSPAVPYVNLEEELTRVAFWNILLPNGL